MDNSLKEILSFYLENEIDEVLSDKPQKHFGIKNSKKTHLLSKEQEGLHDKVAAGLKNDFEKNYQEIETKKGVNISQKSQQPINSSQKIVDLDLKNGSTDNALAALARRQKSQNSTETSPENSENNLKKVMISKTTIQSQSTDSNKKFLSIAEIIADAKKSANNAQNLNELRFAVKNFDGCNLKKMATNTVFGDGNPNAKIMLIGEAPGNNEDLQGIPFCGDSGEMLSQMLAAINLHRESDYYITNAIFWRPPGNRRPTDEELAICRPFVERHIQLISPKIIILVGATAMTAILGISEPISKIRGIFQEFAPNFLSKPITSLTIFHPSFLMRQSAKKRLAWLDMLNLEKFLNNK